MIERCGWLDASAKGRARRTCGSTPPERCFGRSDAVVLSEPTDQASGGCGLDVPYEPGIASKTDISDAPSHLGEHDDLDRSEAAAGSHGHFRHSGLPLCRPGPHRPEPPEADRRPR